MDINAIAVIGAGYVGLVVAGCLAAAGHDVTCVDQAREKIAMLNNRRLPIYEPGLEELIAGGMQRGRLRFATDLSLAVRRCSAIFISVDTPSTPDGKTDLENLFRAARSIGRHMSGYRLIVNKSTVPVGTARRLEQEISGALPPDAAYPFDVVANPEFLSEGQAVADFLHPQRVVIGTRSDRAAAIIRRIYHFYDPERTAVLLTDPESAELIKLAANAFLAIKVSYINEIAGLCGRAGAEISDVARGIGLDSRIGPHFLQPGPGYGGSCLPKDSRALACAARQYGSPLALVEAAIAVNDRRPRYLADRIVRVIGGPRPKTVCLLGLTFKGNTDDTRESPSLALIRALAERGLRIRAFDPRGAANARRALEHSGAAANVVISSSPYEAAQQADAVIIATDWASFKELSLERLRALASGPFFFDLRHLFAQQAVEKAGFSYFGVSI